MHVYFSVVFGDWLLLACKEHIISRFTHWP